MGAVKQLCDNCSHGDSQITLWQQQSRGQSNSSLWQLQSWGQSNNSVTTAVIETVRYIYCGKTTSCQNQKMGTVRQYFRHVWHKVNGKTSKVRQETWEKACMTRPAWQEIHEKARMTKCTWQVTRPAWQEIHKKARMTNCTWQVTRPAWQDVHNVTKCTWQGLYDKTCTT